jgi:hypothetical protein
MLLKIKFTQWVKLYNNTGPEPPHDYFWESLSPYEKHQVQRTALVHDLTYGSKWQKWSWLSLSKKRDLVLALRMVRRMLKAAKEYEKILIALLTQVNSNAAQDSCGMSLYTFC